MRWASSMTMHSSTSRRFAISIVVRRFLTCRIRKRSCCRNFRFGEVDLTTPRWTPTHRCSAFRLESSGREGLRQMRLVPRRHLKSMFVYSPGRKFTEALGRHPAVRQVLLEQSLSDLDHARAQLLVLGRMVALEKVASLLLELWSKSDRSSLQPIQRNSNLPTIMLSMILPALAARPPMH